MLSNVIRRRIRFLNEFKRTLVHIQNLIDYKNEPFVNAVYEVNKNTNKDVCELYSLVCGAIDKSYSFYNRTFRNDMEKLLEEKALTKEDISVISDYFSDMGCFDKEHQIRSIEDIDRRLDVQINDAKKHFDDSYKLYLSFSVMTGILICIIMV